MHIPLAFKHDPLMPTISNSRTTKVGRIRTTYNNRIVKHAFHVKSLSFTHRFRKHLTGTTSHRSHRYFLLCVDTENKAIAVPWQIGISNLVSYRGAERICTDRMSDLKPCCS